MPVRCHRLTLHQFRSYADASFTFAPRINLICGPNGVGKTNVLEALHYLTLSKSFLTSTDAYAVRQGAGAFDVQGDFEGERRGAFRLRLRFAPGEGKTATVNGAPLETLAALIGRVPVVLMAPHDYLLTAGPPEERRRFLNNLLSQAHPVYLDDLMRYNRALRQRNEVLTLARRRRSVNDLLLDSWTEEVAEIGRRVILARREALGQFAVYLDQAYQALDAAVEVPSFTYDQPGLQEDETDEADLLQRFARVRRREIESGRTLVGPHRDDLTFSLDQMQVRRYASQGQHRTFGIALRLAQFFYLRDRAEQMPLLLLDDLFGSLDERRTEVLERLLLSDDVGQSFVTHTSPTLFTDAVDFSSDLHQQIRLTETLRDAPVTPSEAAT